MAPKAAAVPKPLAELKKKQIVYIAREQFNTALNFGDRWDDLADDLTALMSAVQECPSCGGGPCNPTSHIFQPIEYSPPTQSASADVEMLLQQNQNDQQITPSNSPSLPPANGAASRLYLEQEAARQLDAGGLNGVLPDIAELEEPDDQPESQAVAGVSGSGNRLPRSGGRLAGGVRNLINSLLLPTTPRADSPHQSASSGQTTGRPAGQARVPNVTPLVRPPAPVVQLGRHGNRTATPRPVPTVQEPSSDGSLRSTVEQLMLLVRTQSDNAARERDEERALRNEQIRNNNVLAAVLEKLADKPATSDPSSSSSGGKGRVSMVPHANPAALALTGCAVAPKFAIVGDPASVDLKEARHKIKSGRNVGVTLDARINETWPNEYLCPLMMDGLDPKQFDHDKITLIQWAGGFVGKIFAEFPQERNESKEHNQLFILMKMLRLAETQPWTEIMKLNQALFSALERGVLTWLSREALEKWWALAMETINNKASRMQAAKRPMVATAPGQPPAKRVDDKKTVIKKNDVFGVPGDFLRQNNVCIRWNVNSCSEGSDTHPSPDRSATAQVRHICGGCLFLGKPEDTSHPMKSCRNKGADGVFRQQG